MRVTCCAEVSSDALELWIKAHDLNPHQPAYLMRIARFLVAQSDFDSAIYWLDRGLLTNPDSHSLKIELWNLKRRAASWEDLPWITDQLLKLLRSKWASEQIGRVNLHPYLALHLPLTLEELSFNANAFDVYQREQAARFSLSIPQDTPEERQPLKIAYVSPDFRKHPVGLHIKVTRALRFD
jgi:hypothetical protein